MYVYLFILCACARMYLYVPNMCSAQGGHQRGVRYSELELQIVVRCYKSAGLSSNADCIIKPLSHLSN